VRRLVFENSEAETSPSTRRTDEPMSREGLGEGSGKSGEEGGGRAARAESVEKAKKRR